MGFDSKQLQVIAQYFPQNIVDRMVFTLTAIIVAWFFSTLAKRTLKFFMRGIRSRSILPSDLVNKGNTLNSILFSLIDVITFVATLLIILSHWQVDISPLLASAGILGLAASLGSQTLIRDFLAGMFIISENQFNVGDRVTIGTHTGKVVRISMRLTVLKDDSGNYIFIPNSEVKAVIRLKQDAPGKLEKTTRKIGYGGHAAGVPQGAEPKKKPARRG